MTLKIDKPKTPSQRNTIKVVRKHLEKKPTLKFKIIGFKNQAGRNKTGQITIRHKGGGHKKKYRLIDFSRQYETESVVCSIEYDPYRNANISSIFHINENTFSYILTPFDLKVGDIVKSSNSNDTEAKVGYSLPLSLIPAGSYIHNIALKNNKRAIFTRAAGTYAVLLEKTAVLAKIKLSSGCIKHIKSHCRATVGLVSNESAFLAQKGKAGHSRWKNVRPSVRGVAMNPVDHPNGGGEGKKSGAGKTPWGKTIKK